MRKANLETSEALKARLKTDHADYQTACPRCGSDAGYRCRNYKGRGKFRCKERGGEGKGTVAPAAPVPASGPTQRGLYGDVS